MAVITKYMLAEEILRILQGGNMAVGAKVRKEDIYASIAQVANTILKGSYLQENLPMREAIPNGAMMASYTDIPVVKYGEVAKCTLPVMPIKLPRNMGVWSIYNAGNPRQEYIPAEMGNANLIGSQPLLNDLIGIYYEAFGQDIVFTTDITLLGNTTVDMRLVVLDISQYGEWDALPIIADQEYQIKKEVLALHGMQMAPAEKLVDFNKEPRQPITNQQQTR